MLKITGKLKGELEIKRMYLEGIKIKIICPNCNAEQLFDQYLSYPDINTPFGISMFCGSCEHEWIEKVQLDVKLKVIN